MHESPSNLVLKVCEECEFGDLRDGKSYCKKVNVFSQLTKCIQKLALQKFFEDNANLIDTGR